MPPVLKTVRPREPPARGFESYLFRQFAPLAQTAELSPCKRPVAGSIPCTGLHQYQQLVALPALTRHVIGAPLK